MTKIYKVSSILKELDEAIINKNPFSIIRFGDGGIKLMHSVLYNDREQLIAICEREGLPEDRIIELIYLWGAYANKADYIDTPIVYFDNTFWGRYKRGTYKQISEKTRIRLLMWKSLYQKCGIDVNKVKFCNPETNWLSLVKNYPHKNLLNILENRKICCISTYDRISSLRKYDINFFKIAGHNENQYENSFHDVIKYIKKNANEYDLWLNSSGELGRIYSGLIKDLGGRVFDTGFIIDYFNNYIIQDRLKSFITQNPRNKNELILTKIGYRYKRSI